MRERLTFTILLMLSGATSIASSPSTPCVTPVGTGLGCLKSGLVPTTCPVDNPSAPPSQRFNRHWENPAPCYQVDVIGCPTPINPAGVLHDLGATLKIGEPTTGVTERGTILLTTGFGGTGLWEDQGWLADADTAHVPLINGTSAEVVQELQDAGFRTIQIAWSSDWWDEDTETQLALAHDVEQEGLIRTSCRSATVYRWAYNTYVNCPTCKPCPTCAADKAFCGTGNSGGSSQLAYALDAHNQGRDFDGLPPLFDQVVYTSGPVFSDFIAGCSEQTALVPTVSTPGYRRQSKRDLDNAWGERQPSQLGMPAGPCGLLDPIEGGLFVCPSGINTLNCVPDRHGFPSGSALTQAELLAKSSHLPGVGPLQFLHTKITMLTAGNCTSGCCTSDPTNPDNSCINGDDAPGSYASLALYYSAIKAGQGSALLSPWPDLAPDQTQQHNYMSRVGGAKSIRDAFLMDCIPR